MMSRRGFTGCLLLLLCLLQTPFSLAAEGNEAPLANWNLRISVPSGTSAVLQENEYYIYARRKGEIPYVMIRTYRSDDAVALIHDFTAYMRSQYPDLKVTAEAAEKIIGDKHCHEIEYSYTVSGYDVRDRRIVIVAGGMAYMFTSKEIDSLGRTIGGMLEEVVANCTFLSGTQESSGQESGLKEGYLYTLANGMPKYWLDFTRTVEDNLVLHCYFRSGDPAFHESCYVLDLSTAAISVLFSSGSFRSAASFVSVSRFSWTPLNPFFAAFHSPGLQSFHGGSRHARRQDSHRSSSHSQSCPTSFRYEHLRHPPHSLICFWRIRLDTSFP